jgi:hypothetical protein
LEFIVINQYVSGVPIICRNPFILPDRFAASIFICSHFSSAIAQRDNMYNHVTIIDDMSTLLTRRNNWDSVRHVFARDVIDFLYDLSLEVSKKSDLDYNEYKDKLEVMWDNYKPVHVRSGRLQVIFRTQYEKNQRN